MPTVPHPTDASAPLTHTTWLAAAILVAVAGPVLLISNDPPSPTVLNQALSVAGWGGVLAALTATTPRGAPWSAFNRSAMLTAALVLVAAAATTHSWVAGTPWPLALSGAGLLLAAGLVGAAATASYSASLCFAWLSAWSLAGAASVVVGLVQVFAPGLPDGEWIARSTTVGRAVGNLRQPNHLATLLLSSMAALVPLFELARRGRKEFAAANLVLAILLLLLLFGVVLAGSRTGFVGILLLASWGLLDRRLPAAPRVLLIASPIFWLALTWSLNELHASGVMSAPIGAATRLGEGLGTSRYSVWSDALSLIAASPWSGVTFSGFNFAWTLTPFTPRSGEFFDHTHNLPLQLAVELGLPLALLVLGLLIWGLWQAFDRSRRVDGPAGTALRACFVMVLLMALHSQLEYPLWYAYFLLPTAFAWGLCLGAGSPEASAPGAPSGRWVRLAGIAMLVGAAAMLWDYRRVVVIFAPGENAAPLAARIAEGQRSWFFAHHADYALITTADAPVVQPGAFDRATHYLLDTRLMIAWAQALAARGDVDRARHLAARLREFRNPGAAPFFGPCDDPQVVDKPFQCQAPERAYDWRDFRR